MSENAYVWTGRALGGGNLVTCDRCGSLTLIGVTHTCAAFRQVCMPMELHRACQHCWCRQTSADTAGPAHQICCNCGTRQALGTTY